jgi:2-amino-4-hydroxy-6-hydroxymethyldihydropteridine diphosphokinase
MSGVKCAIALGSNLGDSKLILNAAISTLAQTKGIQLIKQSCWYQTAPIGPPQPNYLNGCATLHVILTPQELMHTLLAIEATFQRTRQGQNQPRTLDLDLLLFDDLILDLPDLQIPHPRMYDRAFVLVPLADIAPDWVEPKSGKTIAQLVQVVDRAGILGIEA